jgi:ribose transport system ATP-binding protein
LYVKNIVKQYPGTLALDNVTVQFDSGRVHAFVGKNGSGKSTLLKIISGAEKPTEGKLFLDEEELKFQSPKNAFDQGIATVYQELSLVSSLTVAENILLGRMPLNHGVIDWKAARKFAKDTLEELELSISPDASVSDLSASDRQTVEIAKAMSFHPKVLQLDEPTSALARHETESLFDVVLKLKAKNVVIIYVSHKLQELWHIADTCTVLRDGKYIGTRDVSDLDRKALIHMMFGDVEIRSRPKDLLCGDKVVLDVKNLSSENKFENISFQLHKGEVLGIAGMLGSGRTELLRAIFGADPYDSGEIAFFDKKITAPNPRMMKKIGVGMSSENRQLEGVALAHSIKQNITMASTDLISKGILVDKKLENEFADRQVKDLEIKIGSTVDSIQSLSGGNQQKVVIGNWLNISPKIMIFDEPSKGIDVSAKQQIFQIIWDQARKGMGSIIVSTELEELLEVCHRIIIMFEGKFIDEVKPDGLGIDELYNLCMGGK